MTSEQGSRRGTAPRRSMTFWSHRRAHWASRLVSWAANLVPLMLAMVVFGLLMWLTMPDAPDTTLVAYRPL